MRKITPSILEGVSILLEIFIRLVFSLLVPGLLIFIFYKGTDEYKDLLGRIKYILKRKRA